MISKEENELLCRTGPGTPMGELFRRFWLPVALSRELPKADCPPVRLGILSEDLIAFRDTSGHVGLLSRYCPHRGASLFFGRNEHGGLRCVYHGWKFDANGGLRRHAQRAGRMQLQAQDPSEGLLYSRGRRRDLGVHWVHKRRCRSCPSSNGRWFLRATPTCISASSTAIISRTWRVKWTPATYRSYIASFAPEKFEAAIAGQVLLARAKDSAPKFLVEETECGLAIGARRNWDAEQYYWRVTQFLMPSFNLIPSEAGSPINFAAAVPVDDTNMIGFTATWLPDRR